MSIVRKFHAKKLSKSEICRLLRVPRQRLYVHARAASGSKLTSRPAADGQVMGALRELLSEELRRRHFGYRRWKAVLARKTGMVVHYKRLRHLLKHMGWTQQHIKSGGCRRRMPRPGKPCAPNQVWQVDVTKAYVGGMGWRHHIAVMDVFSREIVGHHESLRVRA